MDEIVNIIREIDLLLDEHVSEQYKDQPLAQDWARVSKVVEEAGEAVDALIGLTGGNPRKGQYGSLDDLLNELADVALTGLYAMQHFTKNEYVTLGRLVVRANHHRSRMRNL